MTINFGVVGKPIGHSLSPLLHNACYSELGVPFLYSAIEVEPGSLHEALARNQLSGCSVTMPLKEEAFSIATSWDKHSTITGACNTLLRVDSDLLGFNTDVFGIQNALQSTPEANSILILGSGATAQSALVAVGELCPEATISIWGRNGAKASDLVTQAKHLGLHGELVSELTREAVSADLVLSTLPGGVLDEFWLTEIEFELPGWFLDVQYGNWPTAASKRFAKDRTISGLEMLKWQAAKQMQIFLDQFASGHEVSAVELVEIMNRALLAR